MKAFLTLPLLTHTIFLLSHAVIISFYFTETCNGWNQGEKHRHNTCSFAFLPPQPQAQHPTARASSLGASPAAKASHTTRNGAHRLPSTHPAGKPRPPAPPRTPSSGRRPAGLSSSSTTRRAGNTAASPTRESPQPLPQRRIPASARLTAPFPPQAFPGAQRSLTWSAKSSAVLMISFWPIAAEKGAPLLSRASGPASRWGAAAAGKEEGRKGEEGERRAAPHRRCCCHVGQALKAPRGRQRQHTRGGRGPAGGAAPPLPLRA